MIVNGEVYLSPPSPSASQRRWTTTTCNQMQPHTTLYNHMQPDRDAQTALGSLLARSWALLRRSWNALGRLWDALGRSWALLLDQNHSKTAPKSNFGRSWLGFEQNLIALGSSLECPGPSKSSSRAGESLIFMFFSFSFQHWLLAQLGASWAPLGLNLEVLGRLFASTWALLGAFWPQLVRSWRQLGLILAHLGPNLAAEPRQGSVPAAQDVPKTP